MPGFTLRVHVPAGLTIADYRGPEDQEPRVPLLIVNEAGHDLLWQVETAQQPGSRWECQVQATLDRAGQDQMLASRAMLDLGPAGWDEETVAIAVLARGRYLSYLPAIYQDDDLMSRFLMLFESFWGPIDHQIANLALYLDPLMAPPEFLSWLATWLDLALDESWPDEKRRRLLQSAASLVSPPGHTPGVDRVSGNLHGRLGARGRTAFGGFSDRPRRPVGNGIRPGPGQPPAYLCGNPVFATCCGGRGRAGASAGRGRAAAQDRSDH